MFKQKIQEDLKSKVKELGFESVDALLVGRSPARSANDALLSIPKNPSFGDYTTNIALQLANQKSDKDQHNPEKIAKQISKKMEELEYLEKVEVAGPGFINFFLKDETLLENVPEVCNYSAFVNPEVELNQEKRKILVEYASFNALKPIHIGHLRNIVLGEAVCRLLETEGNKVFRVTYSSDIGLPSAKVIFGINKLESKFKEAKKGSLKEKMDFLGKAYVEGANAYEEDENSKIEIDDLNKKIYQRDKKIVPVWKEILGWTFEYFKSVYEMVGTKFDAEFLESEVEGLGSEIVRDNIGKVFEMDQGAIIFPGEAHGLHNRVFLTSAGNPTYEAKDMGLARIQYEAFPFDSAIHVVARDQEEYFKVIFKALEQLEPEIASKEMHLSYGYVNLPGGKMSSRTGNVLTLDWLLDEVRKKVAGVMSNIVIPAKAGIHEEKLLNGSPNRSGMTEEEKQQVIGMVSIGAIKFSMLKYSPQTDITFDIEKSVSLEGDSGPYLQYTYARAKSVLRSAAYNYIPGAEAKDLEVEERILLQKIEHFESILEESAESYSPNTLASYLLEFARSFNLFYQKHQIITRPGLSAGKAGEKMELRLALTCAVAVIIKQGLYLLGIEAPERM